MIPLLPPFHKVSCASRAHAARTLSRYDRGKASQSRGFSELIGLSMHNVIFITIASSELSNRHAVIQKIGRSLLSECRLSV